jgi:hypothetical protein
MKAIELLEKVEVFPRLQKLFPEFVESAKTIEVIPWKEDFQIADRNPQVLDTVDFYNQLLKNGLITEDQHRKYIQEAFSEVKGIVSRTEGIAFMTTREISFRSPRPHPSHVIHEVGHVHYQEPDPIWSSVYGGGEALMQLALWKNYITNDATIRRYHKILHDSAIYPQQVADELARTIKQKINIKCYPHLYALQLFSGTIPSDLMEQLQEQELEELYWSINFEDPRWARVQVTHYGLREFMTNLIEGVKWNDSFCIAYAEALTLLMREA